MVPNSLPNDYPDGILAEIVHLEFGMVGICFVSVIRRDVHKPYAIVQYKVCWLIPKIFPHFVY